MKIAVGMSAGVDSTTTVKILKEEGHDVVGVTMLLWNNDERAPLKGSCYSPHQFSIVDECSKYAKEIGIPYYAIDVSEKFRQYVIDYVIKSYKNGETPNPCIACNSLVKFGALFDGINELGIEYDKFATGHYAGIEYNKESSRYMLLRGYDAFKDQSYFLYALSQKQLSEIIFPMQNKTKEEVRKIASTYNLSVANKSESQDFFAGEYHRLFDGDSNSGYIKHYDTNEVLGTHNGIWNYTVGQRKGLGVYFESPLYVVNIDSKANTIFVASKDKTLTKQTKIENINWVSIAKTDKPFRALVKTRSSHKGVLSDVVPQNDGSINIYFDIPTTIPSRGQSSVCYYEDKVLCGGIVN